eukprot:TRINITY_DN348_c1_g3_i5.p1 TRINITY_DN348_c1_g3~~TRINITY_DN348_c1_g3_i5.p1  ORF type:complete len:342 (+),score=-13.30 TRINITY_DN348_c1_g3_i5:141-1028(+)
MNYKIPLYSSHLNYQQTTNKTCLYKSCKKPKSKQHLLHIKMAKSLFKKLLKKLEKKIIKFSLTHLKQLKLKKSLNFISLRIIYNKFRKEFFIAFYNVTSQNQSYQFQSLNITAQVSKSPFQTSLNNPKQQFVNCSLYTCLYLQIHNDGGNVVTLRSDYNVKKVPKINLKQNKKNFKNFNQSQQYHYCTDNHCQNINRICINSTNKPLLNHIQKYQFYDLTIFFYYSGRIFSKIIRVLIIIFKIRKKNLVYQHIQSQHKKSQRITNFLHIKEFTAQKILCITPIQQSNLFNKKSPF